MSYSAIIMLFVCNLAFSAFLYYFFRRMFAVDSGHTWMNAPLPEKPTNILLIAVAFLAKLIGVPLIVALGLAFVQILIVK